MGEYFDNSLLILMVFLVLFPVLVDNIGIQSNKIKNLIKFLFMYIAISFTVYFRENKVCVQNNNSKIDVKRIMRNSAILSSTVYLIVFFAPILSRMIPGLGSIFIGITQSNTGRYFSDAISYILSIITVFFIFNLYNTKNKDNYCNTNPDNTQTIMLILGSFILNIGVDYFFNDIRYISYVDI